MGFFAHMGRCFQAKSCLFWSLTIAYSKIRTWLFIVVVNFASLYYYYLSREGVQSHKDVKNDITRGLIYSVSKESNEGSRFFRVRNKVTLLYREVMTAIADYR